MCTQADNSPLRTPLGLPSPRTRRQVEVVVDAVVVVETWVYRRVWEAGPAVVGAGAVWGALPVWCTPQVGVVGTSHCLAPVAMVTDM